MKLGFWVAVFFFVVSTVLAIKPSLVIRSEKIDPTIMDRVQFRHCMIMATLLSVGFAAVLFISILGERNHQRAEEEAKKSVPICTPPETNLKYSQNGVTIIFTEVPKENNPSLYSFAVEGDDAMTQKLLKSVKNKEVAFESINMCAEALFVIIKEGTFPELVDLEEVKVLFHKFENLFCVKPIFEIKDLSSSLDRPWFSATITNGNRATTDCGEGRTKLQAKFETLKKFFAEAV